MIMLHNSLQYLSSESIGLWCAGLWCIIFEFLLGLYTKGMYHLIFWGVSGF